MGAHFCFCVKNAEGPSAHRHRHFPLWKGPLLCLRPRAAAQYRPPQPPAEKFPFRRAFAFPRTVRRHFFAPARDVKAAASPRPPNFHGPIGKTAGQVYQTTISDSGISFAGITPESPVTVGNITDGSGCGTASIAEACRRVRAPIKLTEYGAHAIGSSKKVWGSFAGEPGSKTVSPRGKDVHSQYGLQQPSSHSSGFPRCGHRHAALCPGLLRPVCGSCSGGLRFCFRAGRRKSRRDLRETGGKECSFFPPAAFRTRLPGRRLHRLPAFLRRLGRRLLQGKNLLCIGVVQILQRIILVLQNFGAAVGEGLLQLHLVCHFLLLGR